MNEEIFKGSPFQQVKFVHTSTLYRQKLLSFKQPHKVFILRSFILRYRKPCILNLFTMTLLCLPTELLLGIFEHLDYFDLTITLPSTCQRFRSMLKSNLTNTPTFNRKLFREDDPLDYQNDNLEGITFSIHPQFARIHLSFANTEYLSAEADHKPPENKTLKHPNATFWDENATSPPVTSLWFVDEYNNASYVEGTGCNGAVSVSDVTIAIGRSARFDSAVRDFGGELGKRIIRPFNGIDERTVVQEDGLVLFERSWGAGWHLRTMEFKDASCRADLISIE